MENKLTQEQIGFFELNGYLALEAVTTSEELEWLCCIYDRLLGKGLVGNRATSSI